MNPLLRNHMNAQHGGWISSRVQRQAFLHKQPSGTPPFSRDLERFLDLAEKANLSRLRPTHRYDVAKHFQQWFESRLGYWQDHVRRQENQGQFQTRWDLVQAADELAKAFRLVASQLAEQESYTLRAQIADSMLQALRMHLLMMQLLLERYREIPGQLWQESYRLHHLAEASDLSLRAQQDSSGETVCIQQIFIQILLMGAIDAYRQTPGLLPWITAYFQRYAAALPLLPYTECPIPVGADSQPAMFLVDLGGNRPPMAPWHLQLTAAEAKTKLPHYSVLDARALEELLPEHLRLLNEGADPALIHETLAQLSAFDRQELIRQLGSALLPETRVAVRQHVWSLPVRITQGLDEIRRAVGYQRHQAHRPLALADGFAPASADWANQWQIVDLSANGMRLVCDRAGTSSIEVGQLLAVQPETSPDPVSIANAETPGHHLPALSIVEVRWIRQNLRGGLQMGVQRLGQESQAARLSLGAGEADILMLDVILLHTTERVCIIAPPSPGIEAGGVGRILDDESNLTQGQRVYFGLNRRRTRHFQLLQYVPLREGTA